MSAPDEQLSIGVYAISLDRAPQRWEAIRRHFGDLPWPLERVPALDAEREAEAILTRRGQGLAHPPDGLGWNPLRFRMLSLVEEAIFCSHLKALDRFLASGRSYGLILEDDAEPQRAVVGELLAIVRSGVDFEVVKLEGFRHHGSRLAVEEARLGNVSLVRSLTPSSGAAAYLVTRESARKLVGLGHAGRMLVPYDDFLVNPSLSGCRTLHLSPYLIWQSGAESTMLHLQKPIKRIRRTDPYHRLLQGVRRGRLRLRLWSDSLDDSFGAVARLKRAPW